MPAHIVVPGFLDSDHYFIPQQRTKLRLEMLDFVIAVSLPEQELMVAITTPVTGPVPDSWNTTRRPSGRSWTWSLLKVGLSTHQRVIVPEAQEQQAAGF